MGANESDFNEIYNLYADDVYRFVLRLCRNETLCEDIVQSTFLKAIEKSHTFSGECSIKTWLCTIAKNEYFNHLKRADNKSVPLDENIEIQSEDPEIAAISRLSALEIIRKVHQLDEPYREIFMLRFYGELKFSEIGEVFGKSENWANVNYYRAKQKLAGMIKEELL